MLMDEWDIRPKNELVCRTLDGGTVTIREKLRDMKYDALSRRGKEWHRKIIRSRKLFPH